MRLTSLTPSLGSCINTISLYNLSRLHTTVMVPTLRTIILLWIPGEYSSRCCVNSSLTLWQSDWCSTLFLPMLYLYFHSIYLFHVILSLCPSSGPFTGPQQLWTLIDLIKKKVSHSKKQEADDIPYIWKNKTGFLSICGCVSTAMWLHHLDSNEMLRDNAKWKLHKNGT